MCRFVAIVVVLGSVNDVGTDQSQYDDAGPYTNVARYYIAAAWNETAVYNGQVNSTIVVGDNMDFTVRPPGSQDKTTYSNVPLRSNQDYCIFIRYDILNEDPGSTMVRRGKLVGKWKPCVTITYESIHQLKNLYEK